jgi:hypothetical protein
MPKYSFTWDVTVVTAYLSSLGENRNLNLKVLTGKLTMLLALTRPCRSSDLVLLDLRYRKYTPEGVVFKRVGLSKQFRQRHLGAEFVFPAFPTNQLLCPVNTLRSYEEEQNH